MFRLTDINGESIVVDGGWIEKLHLQESKARVLATDYKETEVKELSRRKFIVFGERQELLQVIVDAGSWLSLTVRADQRGEVDALITALEKARDSTAA